MQSSKDLNYFKHNIPHFAMEIIQRQYEKKPTYILYRFQDYSPIENSRIILEHLYNAVLLDSTKLFEEYCQWASVLYDRIGLPANTLTHYIEHALEFFKLKYREGLFDQYFYDTVSHFINIALSGISQSVYTIKSYIRIDNPYFSTLKQYTDYLLDMNKDAAIQLIKSLYNQGIAIRDLYKYIFQPFQYELGRLWYIGEITVAQEHYSTAITQYLMSLLYETLFSIPKQNKTLLGLCVSGELHELGMRMTCDYFEACGWRTVYLGANTPEPDVIMTVQKKKPDIIAISCTMAYNLYKVENLIKNMRSEKIEIPILVGGIPFNIDDSIWGKVGANGSAVDFETAYHMAETLIVKGDL